MSKNLKSGRRVVSHSEALAEFKFNIKRVDKGSRKKKELHADMLYHKTLVFTSS